MVGRRCPALSAAAPAARADLARLERQYGTAAARSRRARLRQCLTEGAARFGWDKRTPQPRSMRDGRYLIGQGVAGAAFTPPRRPPQARATPPGRRPPPAP